MVTVKGMVIKYLGYATPKVEVISRSGATFYKTLFWPAGKPLTPGTIKVEVARQWKVSPGEVLIADNIEIPKL